MKANSLRKLNIYMRPEQKATMQLAAARAGMSVSAWGGSIVHAAFGDADGAERTAPPTPKRPRQAEKK
ncbi:hypothetical protein [Polaromonas sp.]|uniref:hypothetical protein n=1 Tax=Polaromonas sp. TaxID=1869339 RepID=UPI0035615135